MRTAVVCFCFSTMSCASPDSTSITRFASGIDAASIGLIEAFEETNRLAADEALIESAMLFARQEPRPDGRTIESLATPEPLISDAIISSRALALEGLRGYARLLVQLSDGTLKAGFASEIDALGGALKGLKQTAVPMVPSIRAVDTGPFVSALNTLGQALIDAKAARTIEAVAPEIHPYLVAIVEALKADLDALDSIAEGRVRQVRGSLSLVLQAVPARVDEQERFALYRDFAEIQRGYEARRLGIARLERALDVLPPAHAAISEPDRPDRDAAIATFLRFSDLAADFYLNAFGD